MVSYFLYWWRFKTLIVWIWNAHTYNIPLVDSLLYFLIVCAAGNVFCCIKDENDHLFLCHEKISLVNADLLASWYSRCSRASTAEATGEAYWSTYCSKCFHRWVVLREFLYISFLWFQVIQLLAKLIVCKYSNMLWEKSSFTFSILIMEQKTRIKPLE